MLRHGQSIWNLENRFTGWTDVPLTETGRQEARECGGQIHCIPFDIAFTSKLQRAQDTLKIVLDSAGQSIPIIEDAALNERSYGDLQGLNKAETAAKYGSEVVHRWRRGFEDRPPNGESLKDTAERSLSYFYSHILPELEAGKNVIISAHGNTLRALLMELDHLEPDQVEQVEIEYCVPITFAYTDGKFAQVLLPNCEIVGQAQALTRAAVAEKA
jgi:2,3-bisphosphoglycerate-dependent phosphoglycerate mutase